MLRRPVLRARLSARSSLLFRTIRPVSTAQPLIRIQNGTFYENYPTPDDAAKGQNSPLFPNLNFVLHSEATEDSNGNQCLQHWAVIGSAGRAQLLDVLRGQYICLPPTARSYPHLLSDEVSEKDPRLRFVGNAVQYIGFSGEGSGAIGGTRGAYLSARYESLREETDWTVNQYLKGQTSLNPLEGEEGGNIGDEQLFAQVVGDLRLEKLLDLPVAHLSNGQTRRCRIAKALLQKPELLLLDDPFMGLDPATVRSISGLLQSLAAKSDPRLILALRPQDPLPDWITHLMVLGTSNQVLLQCNRVEAERIFEIWRHAALGLRKPLGLSKDEEEILHKARQAMDDGSLDRSIVYDLQLSPPKEVSVDLPAAKGGEALIEMDGVRVQYGDKTVLGGWKQKVNQEEKDGLHWTVRRGQQWVVLGANGSGKTTLLSLITSDHPQAYAQPVKLFGKSRLPEAGKPGISIFELQSRLGHSSPEIHAFFPRQLSIRQSIESVFAETFLSKPKLNHDRDLDVSAALRFFKAELDPDAFVTLQQKEPRVPPEARFIFPRLTQRGPHTYVPVDYDVDYADTPLFGELSMAQQRLILFIRALVHKPDIVILDEAFSGMPASMRDKCIHFLEVGECDRTQRPSSITRRTTGKETWLRGFNQPETNMRHRGLSEDQALLMISHNREEVPDSVRYYMRLPFDDGCGINSADFRLGRLKPSSTMNHPRIWNQAWTSEDERQRQAQQQLKKEREQKEKKEKEEREKREKREKKERERRERRERGEKKKKERERDCEKQWKTEQEKKEAKKKEAEKREEAKRKEEKREAEKRKAEKREAEKRETEKREAEKREAEKREEEKRGNYDYGYESYESHDL